jgi:HAD superfamily hydrolase (TIGR01509 family)
MTGFVIDCDGTLLDTETVWTHAERSTVRRHGGAWSTDLKRQFLGRTPRETAALIAAHVAAPPHDVPHIHDQLLAAFDHEVAERSVPLPGAHELLVALRERSIPCAVASNTAVGQVERALASAGLLGLVSTLVCADDDTPPKPAPHVYLKACGRLGIDPCRSVAIEDTQPGVDAARAAGLFTLSVPSPDGQVAADRAIDALWPLDLDETIRAAGGAR